MDFSELRGRLIESLAGSIRDMSVLEAMARVPREQFIPETLRHLAYRDEPLPIGHRQTISQPYIIALMTEALALTGQEKVLEVGTGSGYQTAILAELSQKVLSVERVPELLASAQTVLSKLGYDNIETHQAQTRLGWERGAPYDAIMVTAAAPRVPPELVGQLVLGGRMVIPVGRRHLQELCRVTRRSGRNRVEYLGGCRFVSLIGEGAWDND